MARKKNAKSKANQTTTFQQKNDANISATVWPTGKAAAAEVTSCLVETRQSQKSQSSSNK